MKKCYRCGEVKDLSEFHKNKHRKDGLQTYCKPCMKIRNREYYVSTPERNPQRQVSSLKSRTFAKEFVWNYLLNHPCVDCGNNDPVVLEFDHVRGIKNKAISIMVQRGMGLDKIKEEIVKCDVRCANCHRKVTAERAGWYSGPSN